MFIEHSNWRGGKDLPYRGFLSLFSSKFLAFVPFDTAVLHDSTCFIEMLNWDLLCSVNILCLLCMAGFLLAY